MREMLAAEIFVGIIVLAVEAVCCVTFASLKLNFSTFVLNPLSANTSIEFNLTVEK